MERRVLARGILLGLGTGRELSRELPRKLTAGDEEGGASGQCDARGWSSRRSRACVRSNPGSGRPGFLRLLGHTTGSARCPDGGHGDGERTTWAQPLVPRGPREVREAAREMRGAGTAPPTEYRHACDCNARGHSAAYRFLMDPMGKSRDSTLQSKITDEILSLYQNIRCFLG